MSLLFRKMTPESARLHSLFHRHIRGLSFTADGDGDWVAESSAPTGTLHGASIYASLGDGEVTLWLNSPDWLAAAGKVLGLRPEDVPTLPEELRLAALECFASGVLAAIERGTGLPASLTRFEEGEARPLASACFFAITNGEGLRVRGAWSAPAKGAWLEEVEKALGSLPVPSRRLADDFPLEGSVLAGVWNMPVQELRGLADGDIVLSPCGPERTVTVGGRYHFAARLDEGVLRVDGETMTDGLPFSDRRMDGDEPSGFGSTDKADAGPEDAGHAGGVTAPEDAIDGSLPDESLEERLDGVQVEIQARVGTLCVTLGELRALGEGQVVEFSTPVESPATLVVNGRAVARGELLDVGGRVGVRITDMVK